MGNWGRQRLSALFNMELIWGFFRMKIVKEHNDMVEGLEEKKKSLVVQLEMV